MRLVRLLVLSAVALLLAAAARAQSVHWETSDDPGDLVLTFENCAPDGEPQLPAVNGVQFSRIGQNTSTTIINFRTTNSVQLTYRLRSGSSSPVSIPAFDVKTDQGTQRVAAFTAPAVRSAALDGAAVSRLVPGATTVWAGEVFPLTYTLDVKRSNFNQLAGNPDWNSVPLVAEEWSKPDGAEVVVGGEPRVNVVYRARAFAKTSGPLAVNSVTQLVNLQTGSRGFGFLSMPSVEQISVESNRPQLTVRELPPAPAGFIGAVGQFTLVSKIVPEKAAVGEPVTWTIEFAGTGNWPDIAGLPSREVSNDFQVVQPKAKRTPAEGRLFDATLSEDVVLVPTKAGSYTLGPVNVVYFDPKTGTYKTLSAPRTTLTITAPVAPKLFNVPPPAAPSTARESATQSATNSEAPAPTAPPTVPAAPAGIPSDPLPGTAGAMTPLSVETLVVWLLAPFAALLLFWAWLALRRAQRTDPFRPRREARARLADTLARLRTATEAGRRGLLLKWQHDAAALWQIAHAAPPASTLADPAWAALWAESDSALYGAKTELPSDWVARAAAALEAKRVPGFQPLRLFLPRNLLPFAALAMLFLVPCHTLLAAEDGSVAYRRGDFAAAEKTWRAAIEKTPTDWIARHNLSLALSQQDHAGEAAAQAAAAFVQNPADPSVRWHFALTAEKAGFAPAPLAAFLQPGPVQSLARLASAACWQMTLVACAALAALACGLMLANTYGRRSRTVIWTALSVLAFSVVLAGAALASMLAYGEAIDRRVVVAWHTGTLRSIPTEADTTQKTTPLPAGSVAIADKTFLGWTRLSFENGQTGWVRKDDIVPLWR